MSDGDGYFGDPVAATYDESESAEFEPDLVATTVELLAGLAGDGQALELGIGTGRIALPLAPFTSESRQHVSIWEKPSR